jgi:hypothetical protein
MRGDLSAPVLAIIVTIGIIAAGLVLLAWFWWFAPTAGKAGSLQILGTPVLAKENIGGTDYWVAYIGVRNTGNDPVIITGVVIEGVSFNRYDSTGWIKIDTTYSDQLDPAHSGTIIAKIVASELDLSGKYTATGQIITNYGTYAVNLAIAR